MNANWFNIISAGGKIVSSALENVLENEKPEPRKEPTLPEIIEQARQEWHNAQAYYNTVTDQDLIDHAVYLMQAAEKRYMYLMKKAREEGVTYSPYS